MTTINEIISYISSHHQEISLILAYLSIFFGTILSISRYLKSRKEYNKTIKTKEKEMKYEEENILRKTELSSHQGKISLFRDLLLYKIKRAGDMQELMMLNAKPRADMLFWVGVVLLIVSLFCPIVATLIYIRLEAISPSDIEKLAAIKATLGELPKDVNINTGRDWHFLVGGITFGFLCLASARGVLALQANEMKTYFELGQKVRYFERLYDVVELLTHETKNDVDQNTLQLSAEKLLNDTGPAKAEDKKSEEEAATIAKFMAEAIKSTQGSKIDA